MEEIPGNNEYTIDNLQEGEIKDYIAEEFSESKLFSDLVEEFRNYISKYLDKLKTDKLEKADLEDEMDLGDYPNLEQAIINFPYNPRYTADINRDITKERLFDINNLEGEHSIIFKNYLGDIMKACAIYYVLANIYKFVNNKVLQDVVVGESENQGFSTDPLLKEPVDIDAELIAACSKEISEFKRLKEEIITESRNGIN